VERVRGVATVFAGAAIAITGALGDCPRFGLVLAGVGLMGANVDGLVAVLTARRRSPGQHDHGDDDDDHGRA
jgi:hypothetical protein